MLQNPFTEKRRLAEQDVARLEQRQAYHRQHDMPGTYITGRSGVTAARRRRLDRELDRWIQLAHKVTQARKRLAWRAAQEKAFEEGRIDAMGRRVRPPDAPKRQTRATRRFFKSLSERLFRGNFPEGISYADMGSEERGDFKRLAFLSYRTLTLTFYEGCSIAFQDLIRADADTMIARKGEPFQTDQSGHTIILGWGCHL